MHDAPSGIPIDALSALPQQDEIWLAVIAREIAPQDGMPGAVIMVTELPGHTIIGTDEFERSPLPADVWDAITRMMASPRTGSPRRPTTVELLDADVVAALAGDFQAIGISARVSKDEGLRERLERGVARMAERTRFDGALSDLPVVEEEAWIIDCQQLDTWLRDDEGQLARPWAILVLGPSAILASELMTETPELAHWHDALRKAMTNPVLDSPHRPGRVWVRTADHRLLLEPLLGDIPCSVRNDFGEAVDAVFTDLSRTLDARSPLTPYIRQEGMTIERVGHFFESAATYFRLAPWTFTPTDAVWEVQTAGLENPWFAVVVGQNGETFGVSLVEHFDDCRRMMSGELLDGGIMEISAMCLSFDEAPTMTGADLDAADQFGWPVAAPDAYPLVYRTGLSDRLQTPTAQDFDLLEATIQTLPDFIRSRQHSGTLTALVNGRSIDVRLSRVATSRFRRKRRR
jgi:hypothetical protein